MAAKPPKVKVSAEIKARMREMSAAGAGIKQISAELGVPNLQQISGIIHSFNLTSVDPERVSVRQPEPVYSEPAYEPEYTPEPAQPLGQVSAIAEQQAEVQYQEAGRQEQVASVRQEPEIKPEGQQPMDQQVQPSQQPAGTPQQVVPVRTQINPGMVVGPRPGGAVVQGRPGYVPFSGHGFGRPVESGNYNGFRHEANEEQFLIERKQPPDGFLGGHKPPFTKVDLGNIYGDGHYVIEHVIPGRPKPDVFEYTISNHGAARTPRSPKVDGQQTQAQAAQATETPSVTLKNMVSAAKELAGMNEPKTQQAPVAPVPGPMEQAGANMVTAATKKMLEPPPPAPESKLDGFLTQYMSMMMEQRRIDQERYERERNEREERARLDRTAADERYTREQNAKAAEHDRLMALEEKRHEREISRIREETRAKIDAEKLAADQRERLDREHREGLEKSAREDRSARETIAREERAGREQLARDEASSKEKLERERRTFEQKQEEERTLRVEKAVASANEQSQSVQQTIREENDKYREHLDELHEKDEERLKMREKHMDEVFEMQKATLGEGAGTKMLVDGIAKIVEKADNRVKEAIEVDKLRVILEKNPELAKQIATPAALAQVMAGVQASPAPATPPAPPQATPQAPPAPAPNTTQQTVENQMRDQVNELLKNPTFSEILDEWALHVQQGKKPSWLANSFLANMRPDPAKPGECAKWINFGSYMSVRDWKTMLKVLAPALDQKPEVKKTFEGEYADKFYEGFRSILTVTIEDDTAAYVEQQMQNRAAAAESKPPVAQQPAMAKQ